MTSLNLTQGAQTLDKSKGRISQLVREGKLDGCYQGAGRNRRFDLDAVTTALGKKLDPGQMMGNGAGTRKVLATLKPDATVGGDVQNPGLPLSPAGATKVPAGDDDVYTMARTENASQEANKKQRQNATP